MIELPDGWRITAFCEVCKDDFYKLKIKRDNYKKTITSNTLYDLKLKTLKFISEFKIEKTSYTKIVLSIKDGTDFITDKLSKAYYIKKVAKDFDQSFKVVSFLDNNIKKFKVTK